MELENENEKRFAFYTIQDKLFIIDRDSQKEPAIMVELAEVVRTLHSDHPLYQNPFHYQSRIAYADLARAIIRGLSGSYYAKNDVLEYRHNELRIPNKNITSITLDCISDHIHLRLLYEALLFITDTRSTYNAGIGKEGSAKCKCKNGLEIMFACNKFKGVNYIRFTKGEPEEEVKEND